MTLAYEKDLGQVLKTFRVPWYRSPIDNPTLTQLCESNDLKGAIQALGHFGLFVALGTLAVVFYYQQAVVVICPGFVAAGTRWIKLRPCCP